MGFDKTINAMQGFSNFIMFCSHIQILFLIWLNLGNPCNGLMYSRKVPRWFEVSISSAEAEAAVTEITTKRYIGKRPLRVRVEPLIIPADNGTKQTGTLIFLHDHGKNEGSFKYDMELCRTPYIKVICPSANELPHLDSNKLHYPSWYEDEMLKDIQNFTTFEKMEKAANWTHTLIDQELKNGIAPERIIIGGLSDTAGPALHAALSYPKRLGGIVLLTPLQPYSKTVQYTFNKANRDIPIFHAHILDDPVVYDFLVDNITDCYRKRISKNVLVKKYVSDYTTDDDQLRDVKKFIETYVPEQLPVHFNSPKRF